MPAGDARHHSAIGQSLGNNRNLGCVRPLAAPVVARNHLDPARPDRLSDIIMVVTMDVSILRHDAQRSTRPQQISRWDR